VRARGGNPFAELNLPDALIAFRQGVGRLIRRQDDCGVVTILDSRILHKSYGRQFLNSLPTSRYTRLTRETRAANFRAFD
jgi:ATP-dependent DNA helicase DinG